MNYFSDKVDYINNKVNLLKKNRETRIVYCLNDFCSTTTKTYYFSFFTEGDYVRINVKGNKNIIDCNLTYLDTEILPDNYFLTKKGIYEIRVDLLLTENTPVEIEVFGAVKYATDSCIRVVNFEDCSYILCLQENILALYVYNGEISLIEKIENVVKADICKDGEMLALCYIKNNKIFLKSFLGENNYSTYFQIDGATDIKCAKLQNVRLYIVKDGYLCYLDVTNNSLLKMLDVPADKLFAVNENACIFKDNKGLVRLCSDCANLKILKSLENIYD